MNCPICSQWNPPKARRCAFCGNDPDADVDQTAAGRPIVVTRSNNATAPPRHVAPSSTAAANGQASPEQTAEADRAFRIALGVMAAGGVIIVLSLLIRC